MEKKTLDLTEFIPEDVEIKWNNGILKVTSNVPMSIMMDASEFREINAENLTKQHLEKMRNIIGTILKLRNKEKDVNLFVDNLTMLQFSEVVKYIFEHINATGKTENTAEKKTD